MKSIVYMLPPLLLTALDQAIKVLIRQYPEGTVICRFPPLAEIMHCSNTGAAFSLLADYPWLILLISAALIAAIVIASRRFLVLSGLGRLCLSVLIAGALGNLIDRIVYGYVTDYIHLLFISFPVFNLADILITLSAAAMAILLMMDRLEVHQHTPENEHGSDY